MSVLYVKEQGALIQKRSERLLITRNNQTLLEIPIYNIDSVAVIGNVQITTQALQALMKNGVDVRYFAWSGRYLGTTSAASSRNIFLRLAQYQLYDDMERRMALARRIVANKIGNQMEMIRRWRRDSEETGKEKALRELERLCQRTGSVADSNELMGIEGRASNVYFRQFGAMFRCEFEFSGRNRRPPRDPINVIISLGYTLLTNEVSSALEAESFEMYMGFLHGIRYGRKSLPLDIVEEFRQPVIDRMTIRLFNRSMIQQQDFTQEEDTVILSEDGFRKFCREFEKWMAQPERSGCGICYRSLIRRQADRLKEAVQHGTEYEPYHLGEGEDDTAHEVIDEENSNVVRT